MTESMGAQAKLPTLLGMLLQTTVQLAYKQWVLDDAAPSSCQAATLCKERKELIIFSSTNHTYDDTVTTAYQVAYTMFSTHAPPCCPQSVIYNFSEHDAPPVL